MSESIFPDAYYNNTVEENTIDEYTNIPMLKDFKINVETGELILSENNDFIIVEGMEAIAQMCRRKLLTNRLDKNGNKRWAIYPNNYGSRIDNLFGKSKTDGDQLAYVFVQEAIVKDNVYVNSVSNFSTTLHDGYYTINFKINSIYGSYEDSLDITLQD